MSKDIINIDTSTNLHQRECQLCKDVDLSSLPYSKASFTKVGTLR